MRVARSCRQLDIEAHTLVTANVPGGDSASVHASACEGAHDVEPEADGGVSAASIVALAQRLEVDAVYPGYASHSRHLALAEALQGTSIAIVGGTFEHRERVRDRVALAELADACGVRTVAQRSGIEESADVEAFAYEHGYPVALRARTCGDGAGTHRADDADDAQEAIAAIAQAGGADVLAQRWISRPRHVEVLVASDGEGQQAALCDRERSLSDGRRQCIEECPSPCLVFRADGEAIREALFDAACRIVAAIGHVGVMTVDFLIDIDNRFWLSGVRLGLPKLHAISEMVVGIDLVGLELSLTGGAPLPDEAFSPRLRGHAIGAWLLSEKGHRHETSLLVPPYPSRRVRVEPSVAEKGGRSVDDGSLIAKITSFAPIRHQAVLTLDRVLAGTVVSPDETNIERLRAVLGNESFRAGQYDCTFVERHVGA